MKKIILVLSLFYEEIKKIKFIKKVKHVPQQNNLCDCGVFVCQFMNYISRNKKIDFTYDDIFYFRCLMGIELLQENLLTI